MHMYTYVYSQHKHAHPHTPTNTNTNTNTHKHSDLPVPVGNILARACSELAAEGCTMRVCTSVSVCGMHISGVCVFVTWQPNKGM